ncbi:putative proline-rich protein 21 [Vigna umbellata]|uniref:putative proline-rich protein 21 n=1 Tax=Vigna umbellata TaxID=87088 RepID=UPI001F5E803F|nr:putative proline-rich protein 21 [Vigna umbellata]
MTGPRLTGNERTLDLTIRIPFGLSHPALTLQPRSSSLSYSVWAIRPWLSGLHHFPRPLWSQPFGLKYLASANSASKYSASAIRPQVFDLGHLTSVIQPRPSNLAHLASAIRPRPSGLSHSASVIWYRPFAFGHLASSIQSRPWPPRLGHTFLVIRTPSGLDMQPSTSGLTIQPRPSGLKYSASTIRPKVFGLGNPTLAIRPRPSSLSHPASII